VKQSTQAAVLCGGRGERLRPLSDYFQKVMIPIGPRKLPLLAYIMGLIKHYGITQVALLTGYRSEDIRHYFGDGSAYAVHLTYSEDKKGVKGSLNAVANALENGAISKCDELLIYYGDIVTDLDITALLATHRAKKADATLVLAKDYTLPVGSADVKNGMVTDFHEKPAMDLSVTTGCMVVGKRGMTMIRRLAGKKNTDLMTHFVPTLLARKGRVAAFYTENEWYDVGTISSFEKLNSELGRHPLNYFV
jgi:mannose-1-phosphate guanylyltransferase